MFKALVLCPSNDNTVTGFHASIVDVCLFHFKFVYAHLLTELAEIRQEYPSILRSKKCVGLCLISFLFQSYSLFCRKEHLH